MAKFRNVSPLGALEVTALGRVVDAGEVVDVPDELVPHIAGQAESFEPVDTAAKTAAASADAALAAHADPAPDAPADDVEGGDLGGDAA